MELTTFDQQLLDVLRSRIGHQTDGEIRELYRTKYRGRWFFPRQRDILISMDRLQWHGLVSGYADYDGHQTVFHYQACTEPKAPREPD